MPFLEIKACVACPHHECTDFEEDGSLVLDDMFRIMCSHPEQENPQYYTAKLKNQYNHIYFNCPLEKQNEEDDDY